MSVKLETQTPIDLLHYEPPGVMGATTRQLLCLGATALAGVAAYCFMRYVLHAEDQAGYVFIFTTLPFIALGWAKPYGLPLEVFLKLYIRNLHSPAQRSAVKERNDFLHVPILEKEEAEYPDSCRPLTKRELRKQRRAIHAENRRCWKEIRKAARIQKRKDRKSRRKAA